MLCPYCKNKLFSDVLTTCPFCGKVIEIEHDNGKLQKKISVSQFVPGVKKVPEKRTNGTRGIGTTFSTEVSLDEINPEEQPNYKGSDVPGVFLGLEVDKEQRPTTELYGVLKKEMKDAEEVAGGGEKGNSTGQSISPVVPLAEILVEGNNNVEPSPSPAPPIKEAISPSESLAEQRSDEEEIPVEETKKKGFFGKREKNKLVVDSETPSPATIPSKRKKGRFGRKNNVNEDAKADTNEDEEGQTITENENVLHEDSYDTNNDGYYDDLIPELASQINKIPQENLIKAAMIICFAVFGIIIVIATM